MNGISLIYLSKLKNNPKFEFKEKRIIILNTKNLNN
jgi:hypothetical protein